MKALNILVCVWLLLLIGCQTNFPVTDKEVTLGHKVFDVAEYYITPTIYQTSDIESLMLTSSTIIMNSEWSDIRVGARVRYSASKMIWLHTSQDGFPFLVYYVNVITVTPKQTN